MSAFELLKQMKKILLRNSNRRSKLTLYLRQFQPISTRQCSSWVISKFCILPLWRNIKKVAPSYSFHRLDNSDQHSWVQTFLGLDLLCSDFPFCQCLLSTSISRFHSFLVWDKVLFPTALTTPSLFPGSCCPKRETLSSVSTFVRSKCLSHYHYVIVLTPG